MNPTKAELNRYELLPRSMQSVLSWRQVGAIKAEMKLTDREIGELCGIHETNVYQWRTRRVDQIPGKHAMAISDAFCRWRDDVRGKVHADIEQALENHTLRRAIQAERSRAWQSRHDWTHEVLAITGLAMLVTAIVLGLVFGYGWSAGWGDGPLALLLALAGGLATVAGSCVRAASAGCSASSLLLNGPTTSENTRSQTSTGAVEA